MLLVCPACSSSYRVAPGSVGAGRTVRCARCRVEWFAAEPTTEADEPEPAFDPPPVVVIEGDVIDAFDRRGDQETGTTPDAARATAVGPPRGRLFRSKPGQPKRKTTTRPSAALRKRRRLPAFKARPIAVVAAVLVAVLTSAVLARADIVRSVPELASLYALVGLPVNVRGLEITHVTSVEEIEDGVPILLVTGAITNVTTDPVQAPRLRLAVTAGDDRELYAWTTVLGRPELGGGESVSFRARLASPPAEGRAVSVRFLARQDL